MARRPLTPEEVLIRAPVFWLFNHEISYLSSCASHSQGECRESELHDVDER